MAFRLCDLVDVWNVGLGGDVVWRARVGVVRCIFNEVEVAFTVVRFHLWVALYCDFGKRGVEGLISPYLVGGGSGGAGLLR